MLMTIAAMSTSWAANHGWFFRKSTLGETYQNGKHAVLEEVPMPGPIKEGELAIRIIASSVIPSYRGRMCPETWPQPSDYHPFPLNEAFNIDIVAEVIESKAKGYSAGDRIQGGYPLIEFQTIKADGSDSGFGMPPTVLDKAVPLEKFMSIMSLAGGLTAFYSVEYLEEGKVSEPCDKTVLVTSAASTVGQIAGQLYKNKGCKVIGVTSSRVKADRTMSLGGFDAVIAYREENLEDSLRKLAPEGIDIDFENVGGSQLDVALKLMNAKGKVLLCGFIEDYNRPDNERHGIKQAMDIILKRITVRGLMVVDLLPHLGEAIGRMSALVQSGVLRSEETVIYGFERWGEAIDLMLDSKNFGRLVVKTDSDKQAKGEL